jgi:glutamate/tyrosine decarboxylase-like PLP-dependent enzyme
LVLFSWSIYFTLKNLFLFSEKKTITKKFKGSASECVLVSLLSARGDMLRRLKAKHPFVEDGVLLSKLVMYTSKLGHSCVEKAAMIAMVKIRLLDYDENFSLRGSTVEMAVKNDRSNGLIPFFVISFLVIS